MPTPAAPDRARSEGIVIVLLITLLWQWHQVLSSTVLSSMRYRIGHWAWNGKAYVMCRIDNQCHRINDAAGRYIEFCKGSFLRLYPPGLKIVVDCAHGDLSHYPECTKGARANVIELGTSPNGLTSMVGATVRSLKQNVVAESWPCFALMVMAIALCSSITKATWLTVIVLSLQRQSQIVNFGWRSWVRWWATWDWKWPSPDLGVPFAQ